MFICQIIDKGDFCRVVDEFVCEDESRAYELAEASQKMLTEAKGDWYDYTVKRAELRK